MSDAEALNKLSEMLFGYREAPSDSILARVSQLMQSDKKLRLYKTAPRLAIVVRDAITDLNKALEEINEELEEL